MHVVVMPRPSSHRAQPHERCCGNCRFAKLVAYKHDLLCFHGDVIQIYGQSHYPVDSDHVWMVETQEDVGMIEGDAYSKVWAERIVDSDDVCDEWDS